MPLNPLLSIALWMLQGCNEKQAYTIQSLAEKRRSEQERGDRSMHPEPKKSKMEEQDKHIQSCITDRNKEHAESYHLHRELLQRPAGGRRRRRTASSCCRKEKPGPRELADALLGLPSLSLYQRARRKAPTAFTATSNLPDPAFVRAGCQESRPRSGGRQRQRCEGNLGL